MNPMMNTVHPDYQIVNWRDAEDRLDEIYAMEENYEANPDDWDNDYDDDSLKGLLDVLSNDSVDSPVNKLDVEYPVRWRDKIVGIAQIGSHHIPEYVNNLQFPPNHKNNVLNTLVNKMGRARFLIVNRITGHVLDGQRWAQQPPHAEQDTLTVAYVDLSQEEEEQALAALTPRDDDQDDDSII